MHLSRRQFLTDSLALAGYSSLFSATLTMANELGHFRGKATFESIRDKAIANKWIDLPIGDLMGKIGLSLAGTPYRASTLELATTSEVCSVNFTAFDCFTFFETTLDFARMLKKGGRIPDDLLKEITFTRYRRGAIGDFSTRLHYMTDWLADNEAKHVVQVLSELPGAQKLRLKVGYMSDHPDSSIQMKANPSLIEKIKKTEDEISKHIMTFVPMSLIADAEPLLKTGDIVAVCTNIPGLDVEHTGLVFRDHDNVAHFMDASSRKSVMKVTIEAGLLSESLKRSSTAIGAIFARPLEPR